MLGFQQEEQKGNVKRAPGREKGSGIERTEKEGMKKRPRCGFLDPLKPIKLYKRCIKQRDSWKNN